MRKVLVIMVSLCCLAAFSGISMAVSEETGETASKGVQGKQEKTTQPAGQKNVFDGKNLGFVISYPAGWVYEQPTPYQIVFSGAKGTDAYYSTVSIQNILSTKKGGKHADVASVVGTFKQQFGTGASDVKVYDEKPFVYRMDSNRILEGVEFKAEYTRQNERFKQWLIVIPRVSGEAFHAWSYTSSPNQYDTYLPAAELMLGSWMLK